MNTSHYSVSWPCDYSTISTDSILRHNNLLYFAESAFRPNSKLSKNNRHFICYGHVTTASSSLFVCLSIYLSVCSFLSIFISFHAIIFESPTLDKPVRKQNLGHSRSCILGSLKNRRRTAYSYIIMLASSLKFTKKIASENAENCRCRQPYCRFTPPLRGSSANIRISLTPPETRVIGLHFCR